MMLCRHARAARPGWCRSSRSRGRGKIVWYEGKTDLGLRTEGILVIDCMSTGTMQGSASLDLSVRLW
jgi:hypothetical protein